MRRAWIAPLLLASVTAGCGGKSTDKTDAKTTAAPAGAVPSTTATATATATGTTADCNAVGINPTGMREGTCSHGGISWVIVDEDHTLKLKTLRARLAAVRTARTLTSPTAATTANGRFVIASVTITNELPSRQTFDQASTQQAGLILDGALFREATRAETQADANSCRKLATQIQPGQSDTCDVIFDVPSHAAADLGTHGSGDLYLADFGSDLASNVLPQTIGQIRLYH